jgi:hypothetical protein
MLSTKFDEKLTDASTKYGFNFVEEKPQSDNQNIEWKRVPN